MVRFDVDFFVIGGGSGGVRAARVAAEHGARVAIAEADRWGGTCVIRGCVPKKLLVYAIDIGGRTITAAHILIATGGRARRPSAEWITSDEAFHLPELPRRIAIMGG